MRVAVLAAAMLLASCASPAPRAVTKATFIVIRHAEKVDESRDPDLSEAGRVRAAQLATLLRRRRPDALYTTGFQRTRQTLAPLSQALGTLPRTYDARQPAEAFAAALKGAHPRGTVVVAGHSNTVPAIVAALCGCATAPMRDSEFDRLSIVRLDARGNAELQVTRYGAESIQP